MIPRQLVVEALAADRDLMARVRAGDRDALRALYDLHVGLVHGLGSRILRDPAEVAELVQDVFLHVWRRADLFDGERGTFTGGLVSVTRIRAIERLRSRNASPRTPATAGNDAPATSDPSESAYVVELRQAVARAVGTLPAAQRDALELAYFRGCSLAEIGAHLEAPPAAIRARIRQGMQRLHDLLGESLEAGTDAPAGEAPR